MREPFFHEGNERSAFAAFHKYVDGNPIAIAERRFGQRVAFHQTQLQFGKRQRGMGIPENLEFTFVQKEFDMKTELADERVKRP